MKPVAPRGDLALNADVAVIGSGAGGSAAAAELAAAGLDVVVLEMGEHHPAASFTQREEDMFPRLFQDAGARTTVDRAITVLQGKGLGGSTLHNLNLCKRLDPELLDAWATRHGLRELEQRLSQHYAHMERELAVSAVAPARVNRNNQLLRAGAEALGWAHGPLRHNRVGCIGSGFCELGCAYDAKMNAARVLLPAAERSGARLYTGVRATRIVHRFGRVRGVRGVALDEHGAACGRIRVAAKAVVLAASATGSAALALCSGLRDPHRRLGAGLTLHPGATVGGVFDDPVDGWRGIPQSWECTEHLHPTDPDRRVWLVPVFGHPVTTAALLPAVGPTATRWMAQYRHIAAITPMLHDLSTGRVRVDRHGRPQLHYALCPEDRAMMARGMSAAAQILIAAGAREVFAPTAPATVMRSASEARALGQRDLRPHDPPLAAVHPMGGLCMGADPTTAATNPDGELHHARGVWVADGSLFPSSTGAPPQLTIYALGRMVGQAAAASLA